MEVEQIKLQLEVLKHEYRTKEQELLNQVSLADRLAIGEPIKQIDELDEFMANGHRYIIGTSLTVARFKQFELLQVKVGYGIEFRAMFANLTKVYDFLNDAKLANASVVVHNMMNGIKNKLEERRNEILALCGLFIYREGENLAVYDEKQLDDKIKDWEIEGIDIDNFFRLAFSLVAQFIPVLNQVSANISEEMEVVKSEKPKTNKKKS